MSLERRISRIERQLIKPERPGHVIFLEPGETPESAKLRHMRENGLPRLSGWTMILNMNTTPVPGEQA